MDSNVYVDPIVENRTGLIEIAVTEMNTLLTPTTRRVSTNIRRSNSNMIKKDYCTWFPETWRGVDISGCCKIHDETCSTSRFYKCLRGKIDRVSAFIIAIGGGFGCWVLATKLMFKKLF